MSSPTDPSAPSELYTSYEAELRLLQADLSQKLDQLAEPQHPPETRTALRRQAERSLDEARELLDQMRLEKGNITSTAAKTKVNQRFRNFESDVDGTARKLRDVERGQLFGSGSGSGAKRAGGGGRYMDDPEGDGDGRGGDGGGGGMFGSADEQVAQRQQLLSGTERLERSSGRLRDSHRMALETEDIGRNTLADLSTQRETIVHARSTLLEAEGYTDRSIKTLRGMARRMATNRIIMIAIITVLVLLIIAVIFSKFR